MAKKDQEWLVNDYRIVTVEPIKPKEEELGFFGWCAVWVVVGLIIGFIAKLVGTG
jgi:hypothetical protein